MTLVQLCVKLRFCLRLTSSSEVVLPPLRAMAFKLRYFFSPVCRRHRRARVRIDFSPGATHLRGAISIHVEWVPHVDFMVPQW